MYWKTKFCTYVVALQAGGGEGELGALPTPEDLFCFFVFWYILAGGPQFFFCILVLNTVLGPSKPLTGANMRRAVATQNSSNNNNCI